MEEGHLNWDLKDGRILRGRNNKELPILPPEERKCRGREWERHTHLTKQLAFA